MLGAGTFVSAIIRMVSTVAILAAVYFFIVKPVLNTTENVTNSINSTLHPALRSAQRALRQSGVNPSKIKRQIKVSVNQTTHHIDTSGLSKDAQRVLNCIQHANGNVDKIQNCQP
jgi:predicted PurR-regulated permease PerM